MSRPAIRIAAPIALVGAFWLDWYYVAQPPRSTLTAWQAFPDAARLLVIAAVLALATVLAGERLWARRARALIGIAALGVVFWHVAVVPDVVWREAIEESPDWRFGLRIGAAVALIAAAALAAESLLGRALMRRRWVDVAVVGVVFAVAACSLCRADRINVGSGFGGDGATYGLVALDFPGVVFSKERIATMEQPGGGVDQYYVQKILPSGSVWAALRVAGVPPRFIADVQAAHVTAVINYFAIFNALLVVGCAFLWCGIANQLRLGAKARVLGAVGLFGSYLILKSGWYYPVTTDIAGFALGLAALYLFLTNRTVLLAVTAIAGAFTYPTALYVSAALLVFPRSDSAPKPLDRRPWRSAIGLTLVMLAGYLTLLVRVDDHTLAAALGETHFSRFELPAAAIAMLYLGVAMLVLLVTRRYSLRDVLRRAIRWRTVWVVGLLVAVRVVQEVLSSHGAGLGPYDLPQVFPWRSVAAPGMFAVATVGYYGPIFILGALLWPAVCRRVHGVGPALAAVLAVFVVAGIGTEPRILLNLVPFVVPFVVAVATPEALSWRAITGLGVLALVVSRVWLTIGEMTLQKKEYFVSQRYYHMSIYMSRDAFVLQAIGLVVCAAMVFMIARHMDLRRVWSLETASADR